MGPLILILVAATSQFTLTPGFSLAKAEFRPRVHEAVSLPASCDCKNCECKACDGKCLVARDKVGFSPVAQNCPGGICQIPVARPQPVYVPRPQVRYLPRYSSGGCANGQCSPQRGWFRRR